MSLGRIGERPLPVILATEWPFALLGFITTLGLHGFYSRLRGGAFSPVRVVAMMVVSSYVGAVFWTAAFHLYMRASASAVLSILVGEYARIGYRGPLLDNTVYNALSLLAWSVLYFGIRYQHALQEERERSFRAEAAAHQAQLQMLAYQLNPHFLFNALNSIRAMIDEDRARARSMVTELAGFLRYALLERPLQIARLSEELEAIHGYLQIELIRFEDRLDVTVHMEPAAEQCLVPAFLLNPLVENALKHGSRASPDEPLRVRLGGSVAEDRLLITVENTGSLSSQPASGEPSTWADSRDGRLLGAGIGLRNVQARLEQLFPNRHRMEIMERDGWVRVIVELPAVCSETDPCVVPAVTGPDQRKWTYP